MSIIINEQIEHVRIERDNIACVRDRTISDTQRAVRDLAYSGADVQPLDLGGIREEITDFFAPWIGAAEARIEMLDDERGRGTELRSYAAYDPSREAKLRDAWDWMNKMERGVRNANHAAEEALIRAYEAAYPGAFGRRTSIQEAAE